MSDVLFLDPLFKLTVKTAYFIAGYGGVLGIKRVNRLWAQLALLIVRTLTTVPTRKEMLLVARDFAQNVLKALVCHTAEGDSFLLEGVERFRRYLLDLQEFLDRTEISPFSLIPIAFEEIVNAISFPTDDAINSLSRSIPPSFCETIATVRSTRWLPFRIDGQIPDNFPEQHDEFTFRLVKNPYHSEGRSFVVNRFG